MNIVLASASPRRADLLSLLGLSFQVCAAEIDEQVGANESATDYVCRMASAKAQAVWQQFPAAVVIAADTIAVCGDRILGKAKDEAEALAMLRYLRGQSHKVYTALSMRFQQQYFDELSVTCVQMADYDEALLAAYIANGEWQGKAGACALQGRGALLIDGIEGDVYTVVGLSLTALKRGFYQFNLQKEFLRVFAQADAV